MLAKLYENDLRTIYGNNLIKIANMSNNNIGDLSTLAVKQNIKYKNLPDDEIWRVPILKEMIFARDNNVTIEGLSRRDINDMILYLCTI